MEIVKVFVEDPAALGGGAPLGGGTDDAGARDARGPTAGPEASFDDALGDFLARIRRPASAFARAYLAGSHLADGRPPRVGLTALDAADAWAVPLMAWAGGRTWTRLTEAGRALSVPPAEADAALRRPGDTLALALGPGPVPAGALTAAVRGDRREAADALQALLEADEAVAVCRPEPAHDGHDWSVVARAGLGAALAVAFRAHPAPAGVRRFVVPNVRGEHRFYFEQWALDALPAGAAEV